MTITPATWSEIDTPPQGTSGWIVRRLHPGSKYEILAGRRASDGTNAMLLEVGTRSIAPGTLLPDCVGFQVSLETIEPGAGGRCRICLILKDQRYAEIFATLCNDVIDRVLASIDEPSAARALFARLNTWQRFLEKFGLSLLSREEQAGLFAELVVLESELVPRLGTLGAVRAWRGPFGEPHDFRHGELALETKAATTRTPMSFHVSNLEQLDLGTASRLFVVHLSLIQDAEHGISLPDAVAHVRATLSSTDPGAASEFEACLIEVGYLDAHANFYRERRLAEQQRRWFEVREGFPRLTHSSVPDGVLTTRYTIAIASCAAFEVQSDLPRSLLH